MTDFIILAIIAVIFIIGLRSTAKHFRGEGGCCGGSTYKAKKKKLNTVTSKRILQVEGMSCQNCVNRVMEAINSLDGASAIVNLKKSQVTVSMDHPIEYDVIKAAIERAGYTVTSLR